MAAARIPPTGHMRTLGKFSDSDGLSEFLLGVSVTSTLYCLSEMSAPWGFRVAARTTPAFHLLASGTAWLEVEHEPLPIRLQAGDLVILPRGDAHSVRDSLDSQVRWLDGILAESPPEEGWLQHGGGGVPSELLCGGFAVDQLAARPVLEALPTIVHLRGHEGRAPEWLSSLVRMITVEMASGRPGVEAVVTRLTDALLAQALRQSLIELPAGSRPAVNDPLVARALRMIRQRPGERWSVTSLACTVGLSRSAFAQRFRIATGSTPIQWLTEYRLARAADYLRTSDIGLREIARQTGYDSEVTISKAFRRRFGIPPGAFRKASAGSVTLQDAPALAASAP